MRASRTSTMPAVIRPTMSSSLCTPPTRWMSTRGLSTGEPQRDRRVAAQAAGEAGHRPDHQDQARQHRQPQQHGARDDVVAGDARDAVSRAAGDIGPYGAVVVVQTLLTLSSRTPGIGHRADRVRIEAGPQQRALGQVRVRVAAEHRRPRPAAARSTPAAMVQQFARGRRRRRASRARAGPTRRSSAARRPR